MTGENVVSLRAINALAEPLRLRIRLDGDVVLDELDTFETSTYARVPRSRIRRCGWNPPANPHNAPAFYVDTLSLLNRQRETLLLYGTDGRYGDQPAAGLRSARSHRAGDSARYPRRAGSRADLTIEVDLPGLACHGGTRPDPGRGRRRHTSRPHPGDTGQRGFQRFSSSAFGPGEATDASSACQPAVMTSA
jgi:hypothetical protein